MATPDPIDAFLADLDAALDLPSAERERVVHEVADHLAEDVASGMAGGESRPAAVQGALARIGSPRDIARQYRGSSPATAFLAALGAIGSTFAALWLLSVIVLVLPARDPGGIPFWTGVAITLLGYVALTAVALRPGRRSPMTRTVLAIAGVAAMAVGGSWIATELATTGHFEGYILLLGLVLAGHGTTLLLHGAWGARPRRRAR